MNDLSDEQTDASLLRRYRGGDGDAATELYRRYAQRLLRLTSNQASPALQRRVDPEDIVQSIFRTFFRRVKLGEYDVPASDELWKLFLVIGLNKVRALAIHHQAAKRDVRQTTNEGSDPAIDYAAGKDDLALTALELTIEELLAPLPESYREVIHLRIAGHEVQEIAEKVSRSKRSVERILQDFRQQLHELIHEKA